MKLEDLIIRFEGQRNEVNLNKPTTFIQEPGQHQQNNLVNLESISLGLEKPDEFDIEDKNPYIINLSPQEEVDQPSKKAEVSKKIMKKVSKPKKIKLTEGIRISLFEYCWSFISRSKPLKEKLAILNEGLEIFDNRLDIFSLLKKLRDIDKLKGLLLDKEQLFLFERTSRPELINRASHWYIEEDLSYSQMLENSESKIINAKQGIQEKLKKSKVDEKLLNLFA